MRVPSSQSRSGGRRTGHGRALLACLVVGGCRGREECCDSRGRPLGSRLEVGHGCCIAADPADSSQKMHIQAGLALGSGVAMAKRSIVPGLAEALSTDLGYSSRPLQAEEWEIG